MAIIYVPPQGGNGKGGNYGELERKVNRNAFDISELDKQYDVLEESAEKLDDIHDELRSTNQEQDERLEKIEHDNKIQDIYIKGLFAENSDGRITTEEEGNIHKLELSSDGLASIVEVEGNTMANLVKNGTTEFVLNGDVNVEGTSPVATGTVEGGKVDVELQGRTLVNVCDQKDSIPLTKNYEVIGTNHVALQGEYDGKAKPYVYGNTLVNLTNDIIPTYSSSNLIYFAIFLNYELKRNTTYTIIFNNLSSSFLNKINRGVMVEKWNEGQFIIDGFKWGNNMLTFTTRESANGNQSYRIVPHFYSDDNLFSEDDLTGQESAIVLEGDYTDKDIPEHFTGLQSSFESELVTEGEHQGKYKVEYKVTGKNKFDITQDSSCKATYGTDYQLTNNTIKVFKTENELLHGYQSLDYSIKLKSNTKYSFNCNSVVNKGTTTSGRVLIFIDGVHVATKMISDQFDTFTTSYTGEVTLKFAGNWEDSPSDFDVEFSNIQIEEGTSATTYEPYKEYTKTLYLNSPLLEGDSIEFNGDTIHHVHKYKQVILDGSELDYNMHSVSTDMSNVNLWFAVLPKSIGGKVNTISICDKLPWGITDTTQNEDYEHHRLGFSETYSDKMYFWLAKSRCNTIEECKNYLQNNPITVVYELATPTYEVISTNDNLYVDSYKDGHLDFNTVIPVEKVRFIHGNTPLRYLKPSTNYTVQFESDNSGVIDFVYFGGSSNEYKTNIQVAKGMNKFNLLTGNGTIANRIETGGIGANISNIVVTESTQDFEYFEGMQSCDSEIDVVVSGKNLLNGDMETGTILLSNGENDYANNEIRTKEYSQIKENTDYVISISSRDGDANIATRFYDENYNYISNGVNMKQNLDGYTTVTSPNNARFIRFKSMKNDVTLKFQIEEGTTPTEYEPYKLTTKHISLSEPLRGLPNGVRDRVVKRDGKWYVERNVGVIDITGDESWYVHDDAKENVIEFRHTPSYYPFRKDVNNISNLLDGNCDKIAYGYSGQFKRTCVADNYVYLTVERSALSTQDNNGIQAWIKSIGGYRAIKELETPTYEELTDMEFTTYLDTTHFSTNSTIPCNMKIQNSGYDCVLKPNTTYTVVGLTNGRIGDRIISNRLITTGGTTDVLRPYGSKTCKDVMLFEGNYTGKKIPNYFEGMKSCFEDGVKITSVGKNLYPFGDLIDWTYGNNVYESILCCVKVKPNTKYTLSREGSEGLLHAIEYISNDIDFINETYVNGIYPNYNYNHNSIYVKRDGNEYLIGTGHTTKTFTTGSNIHYLWITGSSGIGDSNDPVNQINIQLEEGTERTEYVPYQSNSIELPLSEPLRGLPNGVCDRIVEKDGKLYIERNCEEVTLDGSEIWYHNAQTDEVDRFAIYSIENAKCEYTLPIVSNRFTYNGDSIIPYTAFVFQEGIVFAVPRIKEGDPIDSFKQWLSDNPTTIVYQLATPIYEEIDQIVLQSYHLGTVIFDTDVPIIKSLVNYTTDMISTYGLRDMDREQDEYINISLLAIDEMYCMIESLLPSTESSEEMVEFYVAMIQRGLKDLEEVPESLKEKVTERLAE